MSKIDLGFLERQWRQGNLHAGFVLGTTYLRGRKGASQDIEKGLGYLRLSGYKGYLRSAMVLTFFFSGKWADERQARHAAARYWDGRFRHILQERGNSGDQWARGQLLAHVSGLRSGKHSWLYDDLINESKLVPWYVKQSRLKGH
jgi:hypothetical protein